MSDKYDADFDKLITQTPKKEQAKMKENLKQLGY